MVKIRILDVAWKSAQVLVGVCGYEAAGSGRSRPCGGLGGLVNTRMASAVQWQHRYHGEQFTALRYRWLARHHRRSRPGARGAIPV